MSSDEILVKVTTQHPAWPLARQTPGSATRWGRYRFLINQPVDRCDYWVVCEGLLETERTNCPPENVVLVTWEPPGSIRPPYARAFLAQFGAVLTCHRSIRHPGIHYGQQGHPWFVERDYDALRREQPSRSHGPRLTMITSDKALTPLQQRRVEFTHHLVEHFGNDVAVGGRGFADVPDKWEFLRKAPYTVVVENAVHPDWLTEKLPDALLAWTVPFYCGAPNVGSYFDSQAIECIDVRDAAGAIARIEAVLNDAAHLERAIPRVGEAREHYLDRLQLFPMLTRLLESLPKDAAARAEAVVLQPERPPSLAWRARRKMRTWH